MIIYLNNCLLPFPCSLFLKHLLIFFLSFSIWGMFATYFSMSDNIFSMVLKRNLVLLELLLLCRKGVISTLLLWRYFILVLEVWLWCVLAYDRVLWVYPAWGLLTSWICKCIFLVKFGCKPWFIQHFFSPVLFLLAFWHSIHIILKLLL